MGLPVISGSKISTANDASPKMKVGAIVSDVNGKLYRYVQIETQDVAKGDVVEFSDTTGKEVTSDKTTSLGRFVAGVAVTTITDAYYGFIQVFGKMSAVKTDGAVVKGDRLVPHASVDKQADTEANGSTVVVTSGQVFGFALATDAGTTSAGTVPAFLNCL